MEKWFHVNFYKENLQRLKGVGAIMCVILLLQSVLVPIYYLIVDGVAWGGYQNPDPFDLTEMGVLLCFLPVAAYGYMRILLKDLNTRNGSDFYLALPVTREATLITGIAAVMTWVFGLFVTATVVEVGIFAAMGYSFEIASIFQLFTFVMIVSFYLSAAVGLAKSFVGTDFSEIVVLLMILIYPRFFIWGIGFIIELANPFIRMMNSGNLIFDIEYNLVVYFAEYGTIIFRSCLYTFLLGCVYLGLSLHFFKKRPSECAGYPATSERVQGVIRTLISLIICLLPIGIMVDTNGELDADEWFLIVVLYIIAIVVYFVYDIIAHKKVSSVKLAAKRIWWLFVCNIITIVFIFGMNSYIRTIHPDADEIDYVVVKEHESSSALLGILQDAKISSEDFKAIVAEELRVATEWKGEYGSYDYRQWVHDGATVRLDKYLRENAWITTGYEYSGKVGVEIHLKNKRVIKRYLIFNRGDFQCIDYTDEIGEHMNAFFRTAKFKDVDLKLYLVHFETNSKKMDEIKLERSEMLLEIWMEEFMSLTGQEKWAMLNTAYVPFGDLSEDNLFLRCDNSYILSNYGYFSTTTIAPIELFPKTCLYLERNNFDFHPYDQDGFR